MAEYLGRPARIEAVQWTGDYTDAAVLAPGKVRVDAPGQKLELLAGKDGGAQGWVPVPMGHWLVRNPGDYSDVWPVDPEYFAEKYRPVSDGPQEGPNLGLATTRQLLVEVAARIEADYHAGGGGLDYSTVKGRPDGASLEDPARRMRMAIEGAVALLKRLGGMLPGSKEVVDAAVDMLERAASR